MNPFADDKDEFGRYDFEGNSGRVDTSGFGNFGGWDDIEDNERNNTRYLQQQIEKKQKNIIQSSNRSLGMVLESEDIGNETAHELVRQGEQLRRTEQKLDKIDSDLNTSQRHITSIKSVFGGIRNYFRKNEQTDSVPETRDSKLKSYLNSSSSKEEEEARNKKRMENHPGMRNLPYNQNNQARSTHQSSSMAAFESQLDDNLDEISSGLSRLKGLAEGLSSELDEQNDDIERLTGKASKVDEKLEKTNKDVKRLLRR